MYGNPARGKPTTPNNADKAECYVAGSVAVSRCMDCG